MLTFEIAKDFRGYLAEVLVKIESDLLDPHVYFTYPGGSSWVYNLTGQFRPNYGLEKDAAEQDAKFPLWYEVDIINSNNYFTYGTVFNHSSIGYVFINALSDQFTKTTRANGETYYKTGIRPQIIVKNNEDYGITSRSDQLIERAITELE